MKTSRHFIFVASVAFSLAITAAGVAAPHKAIDPDSLKHKVRITLGQQLFVKFVTHGDRLLDPKNVERAGNDRATLEIKLGSTDSTPVPVSGVPTRPFLVVSNCFERPLHYRALARLKGSVDFFEVSEGIEPIAPGDQLTKCWRSGELVEEILLFQFTLSPNPSK